MGRLIQLFLILVISPLIQSIALVTSGPSLEFAKWSPDGNHIGYLLGIITQRPAAWAPDGHHILLVRNREPIGTPFYADLYVIHLSSIQ